VAATMALLKAMQELLGETLQMTTAPGGRIVVYASRLRRPISARRVRQIALANGKQASFRILKNEEPHVVFTDADEGPTLPETTEYGTGDAALRLTAQPESIVKLGERSAGSTDVYIVRVGAPVAIVPGGIDEWLKRSKSLDIHIARGELRLLVAQPSLYTLSISRLLRSGQLNVTTKRPKARRPGKLPRRQRPAISRR
jgi:hypothetical protein